VFAVSLAFVPSLQYVAEQVFAQTADRAVIAETAVTVEVLDTDAKRIKGLSGRSSIPQNHVLYFVFDEADYHGIWMKDMHFAIDIIWLNDYNEVITIRKNVSPETYPEVFYPAKPARFVLEAKAGFADRSNLKIGDVFVLP
jgi:uncharacterized membrane protein (UPF0127 family)